MATPDKAEAPQNGADAVAAAPKPTAKDGKGKVVRVMYPNDRYVIEDLPVITTDGVELTAEQYKVAVQHARDEKVRLVDEDGNRLDVEEKK